MEVIIITTFALGIIGLVIYGAYKNHTTCDERAVLIDGTTIDCIRASSYNSGMTHLHQCDGDVIEVPTARIKIIEYIEDKK